MTAIARKEAWLATKKEQSASKYLTYAENTGVFGFAGLQTLCPGFNLVTVIVMAWDLATVRARRERFRSTSPLTSKT